MIAIAVCQASPEHKILEQNYEGIAAALGITYSRRLVRALASELKSRPDIRILDMGCGCGGNAWKLGKTTGAWVLGVDRSAPMLRRAIRLIPTVQADVSASPLVGGVFDGAYAVNLLQLLADRVSFFEEVFRLLKPGGILALPITTPSQVKRRFLNRFFPNLATIESRRYTAIRTLRSELRTVGFGKVWTRPLHLGWFRVDHSYVERQRTGILSGILFLDEAEREAGLKALDKSVQHWETAKSLPTVRWRRTLLVAQKLTEFA